MGNTVDLTTPTTYKSVMSRRDKFFFRYLMYKDDYRLQVISRLKEIYAKVSEIKMDKQLDLTNNIFKTVVKKVSRVYSFGFEREFEDESLEELYKELRIDKFMIEANRYVNAFNDILLQVSWDFNKERPKLIFRLPHRYEISQNDNGDVESIEYIVEITEDYEKWAYWSNDEHYYKIYYADGKADIEAVEGNEEGINPFGRLPFVIMQNGFRDDSFFDTNKGDDLVNITLDNAIYNTFKNHLMKWQTFKQIYITGRGVADFNGQILDPSTALVADGEEVKLGILDLQSNIKELQSVLDNAVANVSINYNISPSQFRMTGQVSSGFALKMENLALDEDTKLQQSDFRHYERELYELIVLVSEKYGVTYKEGFNIRFNEPTYPEDKTTLLDNYTKEIDLGLNNAIEILQKRGKTEEEATEEFNTNLELRNKMLNKVDTQTINIETTGKALGVD